MKFSFSGSEDDYYTSAISGEGSGSDDDYDYSYAYEDEDDYLSGQEEELYTTLEMLTVPLSLTATVGGMLELPCASKVSGCGRIWL